MQGGCAPGAARTIRRTPYSPRRSGPCPRPAPPMQERTLSASDRARTHPPRSSCGAQRRSCAPWLLAKGRGQGPLLQAIQLARGDHRLACGRGFSPDAESSRLKPLPPRLGYNPCSLRKATTASLQFACGRGFSPDAEGSRLKPLPPRLGYSPCSLREATTASTRLRTLSARKIAARWIFTVPSLMPRSRAISLFGLPCE